MSEAKNCYLICEIANVHGGDAEYLVKIINIFNDLDYKNRGIKFQIFKYDLISLPDYEWHPVYKSLYFDKVDWKNFIKLANIGGDVWIDIFDNYGVDVFEENIDLVRGIKLQASVLNNIEVINSLKKIDLREKDLIINISGYSIDQIYDFIGTYRLLCPNIILQLGYQSYPTKIEDTGLQKIALLKAAFPGISLCMADHSDATTNNAKNIPLYASVMGCDMVEKHICLSRPSSKYDSFSSLEPEELNNLSLAFKDLQLATSGKFISKSESEYLSHSVQIPVLKNYVDKDSVLSAHDLIYRRTSQQGLNFDEISRLQMGKMVLKVPKEANSAIKKDDYRPANIAAIVACRMKSTRLKNKAVLPIGGMSSVERCLEQCIGISGLSRTILATSILVEDDILEEHCLGGAVNIWRGDPEDVISRYLGACEKYNIDVIVRVTADCPLIFPEIANYLLLKHFELGGDYTAATNFAVGTSVEIISVNALKKVLDYFGKAKYSEYMTWYFQNNSKYFKINMIDLPPEYVRNYRMTLDYEQDLIFFNMVYEKLKSPSGIKKIEEVFKILDDNPDISAINSHLLLKYKTDQSLIDSLNTETKIN